MKRLALILVVLLSAFAVFASGAKEADDVTTLVWWHSNSGLLGDATNELVERFNEGIGKDEGIYVEAVYQGKANDVLTKVKAVAQSGNLAELPDLAQMDSTGVADMSKAGYIRYIDDLAEECGDDLSFMLDTAVESMKYQGKVIALPFNASTLMYYYNKTAFDEAGIEVPETLDDLISGADKLVQTDANGNVTRYALALVPTTYELITFIGSQHGGSYMTDNRNGHDGTPAKTVFNEEGTLETFLTKLKELNATGALSTQTSNVSSDFAAGRLASMLASSSSLSSLLEAIGGRFELGAAFVPKVNEEATGGVNMSGGALFTFRKDADREKAIWTFMKYLTGAESQLYWLEHTGYLPVNKATYELDEYKEYVTENPLYRVASDQLIASNPELVSLWIPSAYQVYYSFQANIKKMLDEDLPVVDSVNTMAKEINGYLEDFRLQNSDQH